MNPRLMEWRVITFPGAPGALIISRRIWMRGNEPNAGVRAPRAG